jgi:hypothetical protein
MVATRTHGDVRDAADRRTLWFCKNHATRYRLHRRPAIGLGVGGMLALVPGLPAAATLCYQPPALAAVGITGLTSVLLGLTLAGFGKITASRIDDKAIWTNGCGKPFLDSLPPLVEQPNRYR